MWRCKREIMYDDCFKTQRFQSFRSKVSAAKFPHLRDGPEDAHTVREDPIRRVVFSEFSREPLNHFRKLFAELLQA